MCQDSPGNKNVERVDPVSMDRHTCSDIARDLGGRKSKFEYLDIREKVSEEFLFLRGLHPPHPCHEFIVRDHGYRRFLIVRDGRNEMFIPEKIE